MIVSHDLRVSGLFCELKELFARHLFLKDQVIDGGVTLNTYEFDITAQRHNIDL